MKPPRRSPALAERRSTSSLLRKRRRHVFAEKIRPARACSGVPVTAKGT